MGLRGSVPYAITYRIWPEGIPRRSGVARRLLELSLRDRPFRRYRVSAIMTAKTEEGS
jgi:hypothetical protein